MERKKCVPILHALVACLLKYILFMAIQIDTTENSYNLSDFWITEIEDKRINNEIVTLIQMKYTQNVNQIVATELEGKWVKRKINDRGKIGPGLLRV